jgi:uncharacterized protein YfaS (alpha-2-macroglobulin family)
MIRIDIPVEKQKKSSIKIVNKGSSPLYIRFTLEGKPAENKSIALQSVIKLEAIYRDINGSIIDPAEIEQGTDFYVDVTVGNTGATGDLEQLALQQVVASGWQISNDKQLSDTQNQSELNYSYRDLRDDRVLTFFNLPAGKSKSFRVKLNATYIGDFYLPGIVCVAMYDASIQSNTSGLRVKVTPRKERVCSI